MRTASDIFIQLRTLLVPLLLFSFATNLAILISPIFMMQVLDRVIPSGNLNTLVLLLGIALLALATNAFVDFNRDMALGRTARWLDEACMDAALRTNGEARQQAIDSIASLRVFFQGNTPVVALGIPWIPIFLVALALIHPYFLVLVCGLIGCFWLLKITMQTISRSSEKSSVLLGRNAAQTLNDLTGSAQRDSLTTVTENLGDRYREVLRQQYAVENSSAATASLNSSLQGFLRMGAQLTALSLGAFLVVQNELTAGGMIGASIISAKTIGTAESTLQSLPRIRSAFDAAKHLQRQMLVATQRKTEIADLSGALRCENLIFPRGGGAEPRLSRVSFALEPGECLAIVGDSGSGKTTLLHALNGVDPAPIGTVFLDDTEVQTLGPDTQKQMIGYLPQQANLLNGTIADNIASFSAAIEDNKVIRAAKTAGVHGLISALPASYDTNMGEAGYLLSTGQIQRVALARAIYEIPRYLFLDEPNSLLDAQGERQLCDTLALLKSQGVTIVMVLHRSGIMGLSDKVLQLDQGRVADFGPRSDVLGRMSAGQRRLVLPVNAAALQDLADWITSQFARNSDEGFCQKAVLAATEMFNATCINGPQDSQRKVAFHFKFLDAKTCNIRLTDNCTYGLEEKLPKIQSLVKHPEVDMIDISADEMALAVVVQLSDDLKVQATEKMSVMEAWFTSDTAKPDSVISH
ncbi:MAG: ATP-binding cassette domain-containing protein [Rhodobacteraceae bacterium]|nr:ATP-binding cassette domain-containing protein [Paracoccaceae bacterium]